LAKKEGKGFLVSLPRLCNQRRGMLGLDPSERKPGGETKGGRCPGRRPEKTGKRGILSLGTDTSGSSKRETFDEKRGGKYVLSGAEEIKKRA